MDTNTETGESHIIKIFNLETRHWESSHDMKQSKDRRTEKAESSKSVYEDQKN